MSDSGTPAELSERHFADVACAACNCVCDDLQVTVRSNQIAAVENACPRGARWLLAGNATPDMTAWRDGSPCDYRDAMADAAALLKKSRWPLIWGLSRSSTEAHRAAIALADRIGATIDTALSAGQSAATLAFQQTGTSTCSLGELRQRADLIILWRVDPQADRPRFLERFLPDMVGQRASNVPEQRRLVRVGVAPQGDAKRPAAALDIELPGSVDFRAIDALRMLIAGIEPELLEPSLPLDALRELAHLMTTCRTGAVLFDDRLSAGLAGRRALESLLRLVIDLNERVRFYARSLGSPQNVGGADQVLTWQAGYPSAVNFSRGFPRYQPDEFSAIGMLERGEPDVAVIIGTDALQDLPSAAASHLQQIPTVVISSSEAWPWSWQPRVRIMTATYGIHRPGVATRLDGLLLPLRQLLDSSLPSDAEVLRDIDAAMIDR